MSIDKAAIGREKPKKKSSGRKKSLQHQPSNEPQKNVPSLKVFEVEKSISNHNRELSKDT